MTLGQIKSAISFHRERLNSTKKLFCQWIPSISGTRKWCVVPDTHMRDCNRRNARRRARTLLGRQSNERERRDSENSVSSHVVYCVSRRVHSWRPVEANFLICTSKRNCHRIYDSWKTGETCVRERNYDGSELWLKIKQITEILQLSYITNCSTKIIFHECSSVCGKIKFSVLNHLFRKSG